MASRFSVLCLFFLTTLMLRDLPVVHSGLVWSQTFSHQIPFSIDHDGSLHIDEGGSTDGGSASSDGTSHDIIEETPGESSSTQDTGNESSSATGSENGDSGSPSQGSSEQGASSSGKEIVGIHNKYRRTAGASNMKMLTWSEDAARRAQEWANTCPSVAHPHNAASDRKISGFNSCGQNIAWRQESALSWPDALEQWYSEKDHFRYCKQPTGTVGHYTQIMWANTTVVGCGVRKDCDTLGPNTVVYVCNYCNAGNIVTGKPNSQYCPW